MVTCYIIILLRYAYYTMFCWVCPRHPIPYTTTWCSKQYFSKARFYIKDIPLMIEIRKDYFLCETCWCTFMVSRKLQLFQIMTHCCKHILYVLTKEYRSLFWSKIIRKILQLAWLFNVIPYNKNGLGIFLNVIYLALLLNVL